MDRSGVDGKAIESKGRHIVAEGFPLQDKVGSIEVGKQFDCQIIECGQYCMEIEGDKKRVGLPYDIYPDDTRLDWFEKFVQLGDDRNVKQVYVNGRQIL